MNANSAEAIVDQALPWLCALRHQGRSEKTIQTYSFALKNLGNFLEKRGTCEVVAVTANDLESWQGELQRCCQPQTVETFIRAARSWFGWLTAHGFLFSSPAAELHVRRASRPMGLVPSEDDMGRLLESIRGLSPVEVRDRALLETAYATGARLAELAALKTASVELEGRTVRLVGKGRRERVVPLTTEAAKRIKAYLETARPEFVRGHEMELSLWVGSRGGRPMATPAIDAVVTHRADRLGLKITIHAIRRAFATHLLRGGAHPLELMELLGHQSLQHLRHYVGLSGSDVMHAHRQSSIGK